MTGRTLRRTAHAFVAAAAITTLAAEPASALVPAAPDGTAAGATGIVDRLGQEMFGDRGFPSWSRLATRTSGKSSSPAARTAAPATRQVGSSAAAGDAPAEPATQQVSVASAPKRAANDAVWFADGHAGGRDMALALTAAGIGYGTNVGRGDIVGAGHQLGITFGPRIDSPEITRVAEAAWALGGQRMAASGLDFTGRLDAHDIMERAAELGIDVGTQVDPADIEAVLAAGQQQLKQLLDAAGFPHGNVITTSDLRTAARLYGVRIGKALRPADARTIAQTATKRGAADQTQLYARIGKVAFHLPGRRPEYVGFHQSSSKRTLPHVRHGTVLSGFLPSRSRGTHGAGAVDIAMPPGDDVYAPVSGRIVEVKHYSLYGRYPDVRIRIVPDEDTRMLTSLLHLEGPKVRVGDRVEAGKTVIADGARKFPFWSQVDGYSGRPWGHVHIETRWR